MRPLQYCFLNVFFADLHDVLNTLALHDVLNIGTWLMMRDCPFASSEVEELLSGVSKVKTI
jgi:hypothetical protein